SSATSSRFDHAAPPARTCRRCDQKRRDAHTARRLHQETSMFVEGNLLFLLSATLVGTLFLFLLAGIRYIPNDRVGVVEKRWSARGSVKSGVIALRGEAGFQPAVLRGGMHWLMPLQYVVHRLPLVTIPQG